MKLSRTELLLLWVSSLVLTVNTGDTGRRWATHPYSSTDGLCHYGNSMECCWGWTQTDQGGCKPHCQQECKHGVCVGPDRCQCHPGYTGKTCNQDLNECGLRPRPCKHRCMNTAGSYKCYCLVGYTLQHDGVCKDTRNCFYANCQYGCEVVKGDVRCTCPSPGLRLGPDRRTCVDIDECAERKGSCPRDRKCVNTFGSFLCNCPHGLRLTYVNGRYTCLDKDTRPFCSLNPFSPKCRCRGRRCRDVPTVTLLPHTPRTTKTAPPKTTTPTTTSSTRRSTWGRTTHTITTARIASTAVQSSTVSAATVSMATTTAVSSLKTTVSITTTPATVTTAQIFTMASITHNTVPDPVSTITDAASTTHIPSTLTAHTPTSITTVSTTTMPTSTSTTTTTSTPTPSSTIISKTSTPTPSTTLTSTTSTPTPSTTISSTASTPTSSTITTNAPTPSTTITSTTSTPTPRTTTATTTTSTQTPSTSTTLASTTITASPLTTTKKSPSTTITEATSVSIATTSSSSVITTTLDNRINKDLTQRPRGDVHIPRHSTQVWEFDIELGNTAEMRDDPASGLLHCSMERGACDWLSDREGDLDWNTVQSTAGAWYLSVAELKAGQRSVRGARLAVMLAPPWNQEEMCFSFSHWLSGPHVGGLQLFVRKTGHRYSPALWSRTEGQGWKNTLVNLERDTETVLLRAERRRGQRGVIAVDDIRLKRGPCRGHH